MTVEQGRYALPSLPSSAVAQFANICPPLTKCPDAPSPYRAVDGSCNNLVQTDWGKADTALQRIIPPKYGDGLSLSLSLSLNSNFPTSPRERAKTRVASLDDEKKKRRGKVFLATRETFAKVVPFFYFFHRGSQSVPIELIDRFIHLILKL